MVFGNNFRTTYPSVDDILSIARKVLRTLYEGTIEGLDGIKKADIFHQLACDDELEPCRMMNYYSRWMNIYEKEFAFANGCAASLLMLTDILITERACSYGCEDWHKAGPLIRDAHFGELMRYSGNNLRHFTEWSKALDDKRFLAARNVFQKAGLTPPWEGIIALRILSAMQLSSFTDFENNLRETLLFFGQKNL